MSRPSPDGARRAWTDLLGPERAVFEDGRLAPFLENVGGHRRSLSGVVRPATVADVQAVVRIAAAHGAPLYPVSRGCNWGLGSRLPPRDGAALVDLSDLNGIREISVSGRYAVVEAGVTQGQLFRRLRDERLPLMLNVTGSASETSLIGNALDRGVGYFAPRADQLSGLEVVLGTGELIRTGFAHYAGARTAHLFRHGVGPSVDGLFAQGGFGIVTAAGVDLMPKPPASRVILARLAREADLAPCLDALARLRADGWLPTVAHVGNRERSEITLAPLLRRELRAAGVPVAGDGRDQVRRLIERQGFGPWSLVAGLHGPPDFVHAAGRAIRRALRPWARVTSIAPRWLELARQALNGMPGSRWIRTQRAWVQAARPLFDLALGIPGNDALAGVHWPVGDPEDAAGGDPDHSRSGLLYFLPVFPADGAAVAAALAALRAICARHGFELYATLNFMDARSLEGVLSLAFPRDDAARVSAAHACLREAEAWCLDAGYPPYRAGIDSMDLLVRPDDPYWQALRSLKRAWDPAGILAPGRYGL